MNLVQYAKRIQALPIGIFLHRFFLNFGAHMNTYFSTKVKNLFLIKYHIEPPPNYVKS